MEDLRTRVRSPPAPPICRLIRVFGPLFFVFDNFCCHDEDLWVTFLPSKCCLKGCWLKIRSSFRLRVYRGEVPAIGPGKIALLEAIAELGSIRAAAQSLEMSYNRAWLLIHEMNDSFKSPVGESAAGGAKGVGAQVTAVVIQLIQEYRQIELEAESATQSRLKNLTSLLKK